MFLLVPDPLKCIAFGPGLEKAEVGYETEFTVQLRTASGKNITVGGETSVDVQIKVTSISCGLCSCLVNTHIGSP